MNDLFYDAEQQLDQLIGKIFALPEDDQDDIVRSLLASRAERLGIYEQDDYRIRGGL